MTLDLFDQGHHMARPTARARAGDPDTSKAAAASLDEAKLTGLQARILQLFRVYGPMHDAQLYTRLLEQERQLGYTKLTSPSGCRSRRSELSRPNMDWIIASIAEQMRDPFYVKASAETRASNARFRLGQRGLLSPLWDSGRRITVDTKKVIVWEIAHV